MAEPNCYPYGRAYKSQDTFLAHCATFHEPENYCHRCCRSLSSTRTFVDHFRTRKHKNTYCEKCRIDFPTKSERTKHWKTTEEHEFTYDSYCDCVFETPLLMLQHQTEHPEKHNVCHQCEIDFGPVEKLVEHWRTDPKHESTFDRVCRMNFENQEARDAHYLADLGKHNLCLYDDICNELFASPQAYLSYMREHPDKHHMCQLCGREFPSLYMLKAHRVMSQFHGHTCDSICEPGVESHSAMAARPETRPETHPQRPPRDLAFPAFEALIDHRRSVHETPHSEAGGDDFGSAADLRGLII